MRLLLDECVPRPLLRDLTGHDAHHVVDLGWSSKRNGELLTPAPRLTTPSSTAARDVILELSKIARRSPLVIAPRPTNLSHAFETSDG
jgi:hypothetical protein